MFFFFSNVQTRAQPHIAECILAVVLATRVVPPVRTDIAVSVLGTRSLDVLSAAALTVDSPRRTRWSRECTRREQSHRSNLHNGRGNPNRCLRNSNRRSSDHMNRCLLSCGEISDGGSVKVLHCKHLPRTERHVLQELTNVHNLLVELAHVTQCLEMA